jgi:hypothetical protein
VAYFTGDRDVRCVELLNGVEVWSTPLPATSTGKPKLVGDVVVVPTETGPYAVDKDGKQAPVPADLGAENTFVLGGNGDAQTVAVASTATGTEAKDAKTGTVLWTNPETLPFLGESGGFVFLGANSDVVAIDAITGKTTAKVKTKSPITNSKPVSLEYRNTSYVRSSFAVPTQTGVAVFSLSDHKATQLKAGEPMWEKNTPGPVTALLPQKNVLMVLTKDSGELLEQPIPVPKPQFRNYFDNWVFVLTMLCVMSYFIFSFKTNSKTVAGMNKAGRWMLMIGFGAFFGNTVMTRMTYLLDRLMFLVDDWLKPLFYFLFHR